MPPAALTAIMSKAGCSGRHGRNSLALVCKSWADAVAAADLLSGELYVNRCALEKSHSASSALLFVSGNWTGRLLREGLINL